MKNKELNKLYEIRMFLDLWPYPDDYNDPAVKSMALEYDQLHSEIARLLEIKKNMDKYLENWWLKEKENGM